MRLLGRLVSVADLSADERGQMLELMHRHYADVDAAAFAADLAEKPWVICVHHPDTMKLCGFSTQMLLDVVVEGRPIKALFSGDTIVDRDYWGDPALARASGRFALSLIDELPEAELYWFLIAQGYKTYRFLPVFFREFYPRHDVTMPPRMRKLIDALARHKYPTAYDADAGVIRADSNHYRLREGVADVTPERLHDPHVRHFARLNQEHTRGDELCCLAPLTRDNFTTAARRVIGIDEPDVGHDRHSP